VLGAAAALVALSAAAAGPPEHCVGRLGIAVEQRTVAIVLEVPLDAMVGFERAPRSGAERKRVDEAPGPR
jgi:hypothetical protein